jgi:hypothetical protein
LAFHVVAQKEGDIPDVEIQIVNPLKVTLPKADRNFTKVPAMPIEPISPPLVYDYSLVSFTTPSYSPAIRPLRIKPIASITYLPGFISAGFGNYSSPFLKGYISFFPSKSLTTGGLSFHHHSFGRGPVDDKNSSSGFTSVSANIKSANKVSSTEVLAGYENRSGNFYGYAPATDVVKDTIKQTYQTYYISGVLSNSKKSDFNYELRPSFSYLTDKYNAKESDLSLGLNTYYKMKEGGITLDINYALVSRKDSLVEAKPRHLLSITPQYKFKAGDKFFLNAGVTAALENDTIDAKNFHLYPAINADYALGKNFSLFGNLIGEMEKVNLHSLSRENIWMNPNIPIYHTNKGLEFSGGLMGDLGSGFNFTLGFAFTQLKNYFLYQNDSVNQAKFNVIYDDVTRSNYFFVFNFDKGNYSFRLRGDYFGYSTDEQQEAWHRPAYKADAYVVIKAASKLSIVPRFVVMGGMKAYDFPGDAIVSLPTALDLSINTEYNFSERAGAFIKLNNLLNNDYSLFYKYQVRGVQALAGFTWKF